MMMKKEYLTLFLIVIFALGLRLLWLDRVPIAISHDELDYVLDAKAIFLTGKGLDGKWSPLSLTTPPYQVPKAELPALIISPLIGPMELSLFSARLPYAIWGTVLVVVLFLIAKKFFEERTALIVAMVAAINPWSFYFSRTAFDIPLAGVFYLIAFYFLISSKGRKLLYAFPFLFLAFFSYIGTKLIFLPFLLIASFFSWYFLNKKKFTRQYLLLIFISLVVFGWFLVSFESLPVGSRSSELLTPFHSEVVRKVNEDRRLSAIGSLTFLFANKAVVFLKLFLEKYLGIFSTNFLFLLGEGRATYSVWTHGIFYYLDLVFLVLGFCYLFTKNRRLWLFFVALIIIAPLPAALSMTGEEYALRGVLLYPFLIILIGLGVWFLKSFGKSKLFRLGLVSVIVILYLFQLTNFLNIYFFRNPIYNSEGFGFSQRIWVNYVNFVKPKTKRVLIITKNPFGSFKQYLFYSKILNKRTLPLIQEMMVKDEYAWENVHFYSECPRELVINENEVAILLSDSICLDKKEHPYWLSISQLSDGGQVFRIVNDPVCYQFKLNPYPSRIELGDFKVEKLPLERFCQQFISDLTNYSDFKKKITY